MIKRQYFISVVKNHGDGKMSYSYHYSVFTTVSFFPLRADYVMERAIGEIKTQMTHTPGNDIQVIAFNRV